MKRLAAGFALAAFTLWVCLGASPAVRASTLVLFSLLCLAEVLPLALARPPGADNRTSRAIGFLLFALVVVGGAPFGLPSWWSGVAPFLLALVLGILTVAGPPHASRAGTLLVGAIWIGLPTVAILDLAAGPDGGPVLLFVVVVVVAGEIGAFCGGRLIGGPRLAPDLSPGKTWAGFWSQLLVGAALAPAAGLLWPDAPGTTGLVGIGLVLSAAAALGDLYESYWKRSAGQKDSGALIPGHGGALDRADGLLFAALAFQAVLAILPG